MDWQICYLLNWKLVNAVADPLLRKQLPTLPPKYLGVTWDTQIRHFISVWILLLGCLPHYLIRNSKCICFNIIIARLEPELYLKKHRERKTFYNWNMAMKADDLRSLERTENIMVRWMCGVSLKDRCEDKCNLLGINCVADVVRLRRLSLDIWNERVWMIVCLPAEGLWWRGRGVGAGVGRLGNSVWGMTWSCLICNLSGLF